LIIHFWLLAGIGVTAALALFIADFTDIARRSVTP
jgi:hypothetical protein